MTTPLPTCCQPWPGNNRKQIADDTLSKNKTRLEMIRKIELISQSIKGLIIYKQEGIVRGSDH